MTGWQKFRALFGATYILRLGEYGRYETSRIYFNAGFYWLKEATGKFTPLLREHMANSTHELIEKNKHNIQGSLIDKAWVPYQKKVAALYHMMPDGEDE